VETARTLPRLARLGQINDHTRISLGRIIDEQARNAPQGEFLLFDGRVHTYEAVNRRINNVVRGLIEVGVRQGDRVGVLMETRPSALVAIAALSRLGAVAVVMRPDADLGAAVHLGRVTEILTDPPTSMPRADGRGRCWCWAAVKTRDLHLPDDADVIDMEQIDPDAVELPGWYRPNPGWPGTWPSSRSARSAASWSPSRSQLPVGGVGLRNRLDGRPRPPRHRVLPDAAAPRVRAAGQPGRRGSSAAPASRCRGACARTGSSRRCGSTASPWCPTPGRCSATSSTTRRLCCTAIIRWRLFIGSGMPTGLWERVVDAFAPARVVEFFATTDGQAVLANVSGVKNRQQGPPAAGRRAGRARCV